MSVSGNKGATVVKACAPEFLITAMAPKPDGVDMAQMVSFITFNLLQKYKNASDEYRLQKMLYVCKLLKHKIEKYEKISFYMWADFDILLIHNVFL